MMSLLPAIRGNVHDALLASIIGGLLAIATPATAIAANTLPRLLAADFGTFVVRPTQIIASPTAGEIMGGPAAWIGRNPDPAQTGSQFGQIDWSTWTASQAVGHGDLWADNCKPNCADGTYFPLPIKLVATRVRYGAYTRLSISSRTTTEYASVSILKLTQFKPGPQGYTWE